MQNNCFVQGIILGLVYMETEFKTFVTSGWGEEGWGRMKNLLMADCPGVVLFTLGLKISPFVFSCPLCEAEEPHMIGQFTYQHNTSDTTWFQGFLLIQQIS